MTLDERYDPKPIEARWQARWRESRLYRSVVDWSRPKHYALTMLPYPSGDLHIGHWFAMTPSDAHARYMRMKGFNVLFPMGFDAFGLPAENAAITRGIHPATWTHSNIERMRVQLESMGAMFDWEREISSCEPEYYRWTQWIFREFHRHGLAYRGEAMVNWSPSLQTVLANEQVIDGRDERNGQPVVQRMMSQWFFRITKYVDELLAYDRLDWPESIVKKQVEWIGRKAGARVTFEIQGAKPRVDHAMYHPWQAAPRSPGASIEGFTTRPDTLWGATFVVIAPEHPLASTIATPAQRRAVDDYIAAASRKSELERMASERERSGVDTGAKAVNPATGAAIPIWIADYVLIGYGTGAIMAVPAHDERDFAFARAYSLPVVAVIQPEGAPALDGATMAEAYTGPGRMAAPGRPFDGVSSTDARGLDNPAIKAVCHWLESEGHGEAVINLRLRDWLISRQRYWGAPIPMVYRADGAVEEVGDDGLPVRLPEDVRFPPSGQSPLVREPSFYETVDHAGRPARRETDTMDTFMCSSWYQLRYLSPHYAHGPFDPEEAAYWLPVDLYTGGEEHATMHLLYTRFFTQALRDCGAFAQAAAAMKRHGRDPAGVFDEPMLKLRNQGQILGEARSGHFVQCAGRRDGEKFVARSVTVVDATAMVAGFDGVQGEIMRRTENVVHVATVPGQVEGEWQIVEIPADAAISIPGIAGAGQVGQLKQHLEIQRMSKSKGNVVNPDELVQRYGADTVRGYLMFAFDWRKGGPWDSQGIVGVQRFLHDVWRLIATPAPEPVPSGNHAEQKSLLRKAHQTIQRVTLALDTFSFNTAIAAMMELKNAAQKVRPAVYHTPAWADTIAILAKLLAPFTPHIAESLWESVGGAYSVHQQPWPVADASLAADERITLVVQVGGKVRAKLEVPADIDAAGAQAAALADESVQRHLDGKPIAKAIFVPKKLLNLVV